MIKSGFIKDIYYSIENDTENVRVGIETVKYNLKSRDKDVIACVKRYLKTLGLKDILIALDNSLHSTDTKISDRTIKFAVWFKYDPYLRADTYEYMISKIIDKVFIIEKEE